MKNRLRADAMARTLLSIVVVLSVTRPCVASTDTDEDAKARIAFRFGEVLGSKGNSPDAPAVLGTPQAPGEADAALVSEGTPTGENSKDQDKGVPSPKISGQKSQASRLWSRVKSVGSKVKSVALDFGPAVAAVVVPAVVGLSPMPVPAKSLAGGLLGGGLGFVAGARIASRFIPKSSSDGWVGDAIGEGIRMGGILIVGLAGGAIGGILGSFMATVL